MFHMVVDRKTVPFATYEEALLEKIRLKLCCDTASSDIRCGRAGDFDKFAREHYPHEFEAYMKRKEEVRMQRAYVKQQSALAKEEHQRTIAAAQARAERERARRDARKMLDAKVLSGELTKDEYFNAVAAWSIGYPSNNDSL